MHYKFTPILKNTIWGGTKIAPFKNIQTSLRKIGESWEMSGVKGNETVVSEGSEAGRKLNELVAEQREKLVGRANFERFGAEFPLLVKFIDARDDLSIQVHPDDETARRQGRERGKTEMWYLMSSEPEATLLCGLKREISPEEYKKMVAEKTITEAIARYPVGEGDCFFLPAGRIHAIGSGCFLAEIQQTSDVTRPRELHTEEAAESIDYTVLPDYQTHYTPVKNQRVELVSCPYFTTAVYDLDQPFQLDYSALDSFVILVGLSGAAIVTEPDGSHFVLRAGETVLLPATTEKLQVEGTVKFLETYV